MESLEEIKNAHPKVAELCHIEVLNKMALEREKKAAELQKMDRELTRIYFQII